MCMCVHVCVCNAGRYLKQSARLKDPAEMDRLISANNSSATVVLFDNSNKLASIANARNRTKGRISHRR